MKAMLLVFSALLLLLSPVQAEDTTISHGISIHGVPIYPENFKYLKYVNPNAVKGGDVVLASIGGSGFDSFNAYIPKGVSADGLGLIYDRLMEQTLDDPSTEYGLIAKKIEFPADRSWVTFYLNPKAYFHDGQPISADDVKFSFDILMEKGSPLYKFYYRDVKEVKIINKNKVRFNFNAGVNRELPVIIGELPILPKHFWQGKDFSKTSLEPPLGSGPYKIKAFKEGRSVTYERVKNYWAKDLPINRGRYNFDTITFDHYRDRTVAIEAFKSGEFDFREENTSKLWATAYESRALREGKIIKVEIPHQMPTGMQGYVFNTRREFFKDRKVRQALAYAFDFEWTNKQFMYNAYSRTKSYFSNSDLASSGLPDKEELKILEPLRKQIPEEVFTKTYEPPKTDGSGRNRINLRKAMKLLKEAGWVIKNKQLVYAKTGLPLKFEIILAQKGFEMLTQPFIKNLRRLGVRATLRYLADTQQYINRMRSFDFDMIISTFAQSNSPGNEQRDFWSSASAERQDSRNLIGIKDPAVDQLVELVISAKDRAELITRTRALDRVLLWGYYVIPHWNIRYFRVAYWNKFERPSITPKYGLGFDTWWISTQREKLINEIQKGK